MRRLTLDERKKFLEDDLSDALKGLFVGAVVWAAADASERCPFQKGLGMFTNLVQARSLYESAFGHLVRSGTDKRTAERPTSPWSVPVGR